MLKIKRVITLLLLGCFFLQTALPSPALAQNVLGLPATGTMVSLSSAFNPVLLRGVKIYPDDPFKFDFIVDNGDEKLGKDNFKAESEKLIRYFLASLSIPEHDLWVNLSPYEKDRIIPEALAQTEMGADMLAQDYLLKQITASLIYPEGDTGKKFWDKVYKKAYEQFGTTEIPVDTFNKVWIIPQKAVVYEQGDKAFVVESKLKVMLEEDYVALEKGAEGQRVKGLKENLTNPTTSNPLTLKSSNPTSTLSSQIVREIVIPELEKEVNSGKNFAKLRQIYHALILATWFKQKLKNSLLSQIYADHKKIKGIDLSGKETTQKIYEQYVTAFKKGVCNYLKVEYDVYEKKNVARKYFSGGIEWLASSNIQYVSTLSGAAPAWASSTFSDVQFKLQPFQQANTAAPISSPLIEPSSQETAAAFGAHSSMSKLISLFNDATQNKKKGTPGNIFLYGAQDSLEGILKLAQAFPEKQIYVAEESPNASKLWVALRDTSAEIQSRVHLILGEAIDLKNTIIDGQMEAVFVDSDLYGLVANYSSYVDDFLKEMNRILAPGGIFVADVSPTDAVSKAVASLEAQGFQKVRLEQIDKSSTMAFLAFEKIKTNGVSSAIKSSSSSIKPGKYMLSKDFTSLKKGQFVYSETFGVCEVLEDSVDNKVSVEQVLDVVPKKELPENIMIREGPVRLAIEVGGQKKLWLLLPADKKAKKVDMVLVSIEDAQEYVELEKVSSKDEKGFFDKEGNPIEEGPPLKIKKEKIKGKKQTGPVFPGTLLGEMAKKLDKKILKSNKEKGTRSKEREFTLKARVNGNILGIYLVTERDKKGVETLLPAVVLFRDGKSYTTKASLEAVSIVEERDPGFEYTKGYLLGDWESLKDERPVESFLDWRKYNFEKAILDLITQALPKNWIQKDEFPKKYREAFISALMTYCQRPSISFLGKNGFVVYLLQEWKISRADLSHIFGVTRKMVRSWINTDPKAKKMAKNFIMPRTVDKFIQRFNLSQRDASLLWRLMRGDQGLSLDGIIKKWQERIDKESLGKGFVDRSKIFLEVFSDLCNFSGLPDEFIQEKMGLKNEAAIPSWRYRKGGPRQLSRATALRIAEIFTVIDKKFTQDIAYLLLGISRNQSFDELFHRVKDPKDPLDYGDMIRLMRILRGQGRREFFEPVREKDVNLKPISIQRLEELLGVLEKNQHLSVFQENFAQAIAKEVGLADKDDEKLLIEMEMGRVSTGKKPLPASSTLVSPTGSSPVGSSPVIQSDKWWKGIVSEPHLNKKDAYGRALRALLKGSYVTEESKKRLQVLSEVGEQLEKFVQELFGSPQIRIAIIPLGDTLKGSANEKSTIEAEVCILGGIDKSWDVTEAESERIYDKFSELLEEKGYSLAFSTAILVDMNNLKSEEFVGEIEFSEKLKERCSKIFLPFAYGNKRLIENIREKIIREFSVQENAHFLWSLIRREYQKNIDITTEDILTWLAVQGDPSIAKAIEKFTRIRQRSVELPSLEEMAKAYNLPAASSALSEIPGGSSSVLSIPAIPDSENAKTLYTAVCNAMAAAYSGVRKISVVRGCTEHEWFEVDVNQKQFPPDFKELLFLTSDKKHFIFEKRGGFWCLYSQGDFPDEIIVPGAPQIFLPVPKKTAEKRLEEPIANNDVFDFKGSGTNAAQYMDKALEEIGQGTLQLEKNPSAQLRIKAVKYIHFIGVKSILAYLKDCKDQSRSNKGNLKGVILLSAEDGKEVSYAAAEGRLEEIKMGQGDVKKCSLHSFSFTEPNNKESRLLVLYDGNSLSADHFLNKKLKDRAAVEERAGNLSLTLAKLQKDEQWFQSVRRLSDQEISGLGVDGYAFLGQVGEVIQNIDQDLKDPRAEGVHVISSRSGRTPSYQEFKEGLSRYQGKFSVHKFICREENTESHVYVLTISEGSDAWFFGSDPGAGKASSSSIQTPSDGVNGPVDGGVMGNDVVIPTQFGKKTVFHFVPVHNYSFNVQDKDKIPLERFFTGSDIDELTGKTGDQASGYTFRFTREYLREILNDTFRTNGVSKLIDENLLKIYKEDIKETIASIARQGNHEMQVYAIGIGQDAAEYIQIVNLLHRAFEESNLKDIDSWRVKLILMDCSEDMLRKAYGAQHENVDLLKEIPFNLDIYPVQADLLDRERIEEISKEMGKADYIFNRNTLYGHSVLGWSDWKEELGGIGKDKKYNIFMFNPESVSRIFSAYLGTRNIITFLAREGTHYITEETIRDKVFMIPGTNILTPVYFKEVPNTASFQGTGMYEVVNPGLMAKEGFTSFLKYVESQGKSSSSAVIEGGKGPASSAAGEKMKEIGQWLRVQRNKNDEAPIIFVNGPPAAGKTTIVRSIIETLLKEKGITDFDWKDARKDSEKRARKELSNYGIKYYNEYDEGEELAVWRSHINKDDVVIAETVWDCIPSVWENLDRLLLVLVVPEDEEARKQKIRERSQDRYSTQSQEYVFETDYTHPGWVPPNIKNVITVVNNYEEIPQALAQSFEEGLTASSSVAPTGGIDGSAGSTQRVLDEGFSKEVGTSSPPGSSPIQGAKGSGASALALTDAEKNALETVYSKENIEKALEVPWEECIRWQEPLETINQKNYFENQKDVRAGFLKLIAAMIPVDGKEPEIKTSKEFREKLRELHILLMTGANGDRFYIPENMWKIGSEDPAVFLKGSRTHMDDFNKAVTLFQDEFFASFGFKGAFKYLTETRIDRLLKNLGYFISPGKTLEKRIKIIKEFYLNGLGRINNVDDRHLLFENGNISIIFNMVNAMLRLHGLNGMSHGILDVKISTLPQGEVGQYMNNEFYAMVQAANRQVKLNLPSEDSGIAGSPVGSSPLIEGGNGLAAGEMQSSPLKVDLKFRAQAQKTLSTFVKFWESSERRAEDKYDDLITDEDSFFVFSDEDKSPAKILPKEYGSNKIDIMTGVGIEKVLNKEEDYDIGSYGYQNCVCAVIIGRNESEKVVLIPWHTAVWDEQFLKKKIKGLHDVQLVLSPELGVWEEDIKGIEERLGSQIERITVLYRKEMLHAVFSREGIILLLGDWSPKALQKNRFAAVRWEDLLPGTFDLQKIIDE